ncbi:MAG: hypothetical protein BWY31_00347 [Lentisphaerae bacterium ADurb.Bin242]|nr:MAG: hypothetical protein BWY31_00347 [Lentisphaerae bacterium ADurb.Bin242]
MKKNYFTPFVFLLTLFSTLVATSCGDNSPKALSEMSPTEIANLYIKFRNDETTNNIKTIVFFPKNELWVRNLMKSSPEKDLDKIGLKLKVDYEKVIDDNMAEVGIIVDFPIKGRIPQKQFILKKRDGGWKLYHHKFEDRSLEELLHMANASIVDPDVYFYLGRHYSVDRYGKASEYYKKYLEVSDNKFWDGPDLQMVIKQGNEIDSFIEQQTRIIDAGPLLQRHAVICAKLALAYIDKGDLQNAEKYLSKMKIINDQKPNKARREYYEKIKKELDALKLTK